MGDLSRTSKEEVGSDIPLQAGDWGGEDRADELEILSDQDLTAKSDITSLDENLGAKSKSLGSLEDESPDFMRGELDVKEQMDRAQEAFASSIHGETNLARDPQSELEASFRHTPGGLEEVIMKTEEEMIHRRHPRARRTRA